MKLEKRIGRVYMAHTGSLSEYGSKAWFAAQLDVAPGTVTRWLTGRRRFRGAAKKLLENLEAQVIASSAKVD